jgi:exodeoxyribonuclease VII small subunit
MPKPSDTATPTPSIAEFEHSLDELDQLVTRMEGGELSLDDSLKSFERGIGLYRHCQTALEQAELRVRLLLDPEAPDTAEPFDSHID